MIKVSDDVVHYEISSLNELQKIFVSYKPIEHVGGWLYRGHSDESWPLIPKAGRPQFDCQDGSDWAMFSIWKDKAIAFTDLPENELECLAIAQHHGLATRLLDWSNNPLIATYFSCKDLPSKDGAIYVFYPDNLLEEEAFNYRDVTEVKQYIPRSIVTRILNQSGRFTYHPNPSKEIEFGELSHPFVGQKLKKILIPKEAKEHILDELNIYNINELSLFPDLDGLSRHFNWLKENRKGP